MRQYWHIVAFLAGTAMAFSAGAQTEQPIQQERDAFHQPMVLKEAQLKRVQLKDAADYKTFLVFDGPREKATYLGVGGSEVPAVLREQLKLPKGIGIVVDHVEKGSPAEVAGLKVYDVLKKLDDQWLVTMEQLAVLVRMHKSGDQVKLTLIREGQSRTVTANLIQKDGVSVERNDLRGLADFATVRLQPAAGLADLATNTLQPTTQPYSVALNYIARVAAAPEQNAYVSFKNLPASTKEYTWSDGQHTLTLKVSVAEGGKRQISLVAKDQSGQVQFDGPINTDDQRNAVPKGIAEKLPSAMAKALLEAN